jgi:hypothetical protein
MQLRVWQAIRIAWLSEAALLAGHMEQSTQRAHQALDLARAHQERGNQAWAFRLLGAIAVHHEPPAVESAQDYYCQALTLAEELGMPPLQAHCHHGLGTLSAKIGRREQACAELSTASVLYRAMDMTFWLPQEEAALAQAEGW